MFRLSPTDEVYNTEYLGYMRINSPFFGRMWRFYSKLGYTDLVDFFNWCKSECNVYYGKFNQHTY